MLRIGDHLRQIARLLILAALSILVNGCFGPAQAQQSRQKTFTSAEEACAALVSAVQQEDQSALPDLLGPTAKQIISVGDETEDRISRRRFVEKYREMRRLVQEADGTITLYVGAENWPLPIPLKHKANKWYFDTAASRPEIAFRRIGRNELATIDVCGELVSAQNEYYAETRDGGAKQFAPRFRSDDGKHNGLYWKISDREPTSPVGQLLMMANTDEFARETSRPLPFHGYYYRILTRQGSHAPGGAKNYLVNGAMTGGFAFVAYPAEYRSSGVMTFIVNRDGIVYQKNLGPRTATRAKALTQYDPDSTWKRVE